MSAFLSVSIVLAAATDPVIDAVHVEGDHAMAGDDLLKRIPIKSGQPFDAEQLRFSIGVLESVYRDQGYYDVHISSALRTVAPQKVDVLFKIHEGDIYQIGMIDIEGNTTITDKIILRELQMDTDERFSQSKIFEGNRRLYMTGYFDTIDLDYSTSTANTVDVKITVKERATRFIKGGFGYGAESKERLSLGYEDINFLGNARKLDIKATHSGFATKPAFYRTTLLEANLTQPYFLNTSLEGLVNLSREWKDREAYDGVTTALRGSLGRRFGPSITSSLRYRYQGTRVSRVSPEAETESFTNISALGPTFTYDNTNDAFLPSNGWRVMGTYEEGLRFYVGDVRFHKLESRAGRYDTVFGRWTFFEGLQAGVIRPDTGSANDAIPIFERYFLGGANTVRGYTESEIGPRDVAGKPIGGHAFIVGNLELRHPLYKKLFGVVFVDGGQLYPTPTGSVWPYMRMKSTDDFLYGTGIGLRLHSPIGAVRLEFGYKLNPPGGKKFLDRTAIHFSIGEVF